ncbi:hypothetical protein [Thermaurantimonas aggregans]|uniref:hypothetical protein n=1 Tax=Thermaurantimonas aggregans TaxID=2173829 RepID=UPI000F5617CE|nr:hypothetical protein [Thermaurantimonas aggregans]MCX8148215.1 hypothetical protein [Thermaurantimonas aggregans]
MPLPGSGYSGVRFASVLRQGCALPSHRAFARPPYPSRALLTPHPIIANVATIFQPTHPKTIDLR